MNYPWGKIGTNSLASRFLSHFDPKLAYAELWYGAHPKAPSSTDTSDLLSVIKCNPEILGEFESLPFLAKFLSIKNALSIQCHPTREQAKNLHQKDALNYPDSNHKPEIAIAITPVRLLQGWIDSGELSEIKNSFPEVFEALSAFCQTQDWSSNIRKHLLLSIFKQELATKVTAQIVARLQDKSILSNREKSFLDLARQYGDSDNGVVLSLFLRLIELKPFESLYTPCGEIHAYIDGDLFECMASSDNVLRAGLTNKYQSLEDLLTCGNFEIAQVQPKKSSVYTEDKNFQVFDSACNDFKVLFCDNSNSEFKIATSSKSLQMLIVFNGELVINSELYLGAGQAVFIGANSKDISLKTENCSFFRVLRSS
jgi:mannose-6-phosphate isomerase